MFHVSSLRLPASGRAHELSLVDTLKCHQLSIEYHQINAEQFVNAGLTGKAIGESLRNARKICLAELKQQF